jgi:N6-adenosine-specific RNA methylase IME4
MTTKRYGVILADPPWNYANAGCRGAAENHYSTMTVAGICALPVADMAASDSVLLMWCTWPQMQEGMQVMNEWGFRYVTGFPWVKVTDVSKDLWGDLNIKVPYGIGFWARGCTEFVMIGVRGNAKPPKDGFIGLLSPNLRHSRKPESLHHYAMSLPGPYLEMFARRPFPGFDIWGNEVESTLSLEAV